MIQVNRNTQHITEYTPLLYYTRTREIILYTHEKTEKRQRKR